MSAAGGLCLLAAGASLALGAPTVTLRWTHSIARQTFEEDWAATPVGLALTEARSRGPATGMEVGEGAVRGADGWWRWRPALPPLPELTLRRSGAVADWTLCVAETCRPLGEGLPEGADPVTLAPCPG